MQSDFGLFARMPTVTGSVAASAAPRLCAQSARSYARRGRSASGEAGVSRPACDGVHPCERVAPRVARPERELP